MLHEAGEGEDDGVGHRHWGPWRTVSATGPRVADGRSRVPELEPCRTLAQLGDEAVSDANRQKAQNVIAFDDSETRPITSFTRREVTLAPSIYTDEFKRYTETVRS